MLVDCFFDCARNNINHITNMKKLLMIALCLVFTLGTWAQEERASVLEGARDKKDKQKEVYIDLGAREGAYKGLHMGVYTVKTVAGKEAKKQIGKLKIEEVQGDDISLCKVQSGGRDIKSALDNGETLVIETTD